MSRKRKIYSKEFKSDAIEMAKELGITKAAEKLGINPTNIRRWRGDFEDKESGPSDMSVEELKKRNKQLEKENGYLRKINEVLEKSTAIFSNDQIPRL